VNGLFEATELTISPRGEKGTRIFLEKAQGTATIRNVAQKKESFEESLRQVEEVVKDLESGKLGLEESLEKYELGINAIRKCYEILDAAEKKIQTLIKDKNGKLSIKETRTE
jgi:exodeoxyribonuclease VII small subunit